MMTQQVGPFLWGGERLRFVFKPFMTGLSEVSKTQWELSVSLPRS